MYIRVQTQRSRFATMRIQNIQRAHLTFDLRLSCSVLSNISLSLPSSHRESSPARDPDKRSGVSRFQKAATNCKNLTIPLSSLLMPPFLHHDRTRVLVFRRERTDASHDACIYLCCVVAVVVIRLLSVFATDGLPFAQVGRHIALLQRASFHVQSLFSHLSLTHIHAFSLFHEYAFKSCVKRYIDSYLILR